MENVRQQLMDGVCICIPTKDRPEMVEEVLQYTFPYYIQYKFKIIYFDSSINDMTKKVIESYQERGFHNLVWKFMDSNLCLDRKTFEIISGDEDIYNADYIWFINDSIAILKDALAEIALIVQKRRYDLIRLPAAGEGNKEDYICDDINKWFQTCSKGMAHMASTIMSSTLLKADPDWDMLYRKYVVTDMIGDEQHEYFFTLGLYLEQIAKLNRFTGIMIGKRMQWRRDSPYKKGKSYWNDLVFEVWARSYCDTILKLPDCYTDKEEVIRRSDNIVYGRFERQSMLRYRCSGLLTETVALKYKKYWKMVSTLTFDEIRKIASEPLETVQDQLGNRYIGFSDWEENVEKLAIYLQGKPFIIFGAGMYGSYVLKKLIQNGYKDSIAGVAVSDPTVNLDFLDGYPVRSINDFLPLKEEAAVFISTLPDAGAEINIMLEKMGFKNRYLIFEEINGKWGDNNEKASY